MNANAANITIEAICGRVRSVQGATLQPDGLWVGSGGTVSYTVLLQLPEGEQEVAGVKPANGRLPGAYDIVAHSPGTAVGGWRINGRIELAFTETPYWEECPNG